ncbi:hypothetical protein L1787_12970 [Acuticoccus sp. M5D2P5]|uniref:hypothetical protein n=1 Tax=Acuticoccus kalidii TaxID=2910977 RepID=UPI001F1CE631|nr:hypothetical protein [Acuticoccus kalidii]MCF3934321.1 hypothetical protein [Acuticoccus kalidii]
MNTTEAARILTNFYQVEGTYEFGHPVDARSQLPRHVSEAWGQMLKTASRKLKGEDE